MKYPRRDMAGYGGIPGDTGRYREMPGDTRYGQIRADMGADTGRYREMRGDAGRCGEVRGDTGMGDTAKEPAPHQGCPSPRPLLQPRRADGRDEPLPCARCATPPSPPRTHTVDTHTHHTHIQDKPGVLQRQEKMGRRRPTGRLPAYATSQRGAAIAEAVPPVPKHNSQTRSVAAR